MHKDVGALGKLHEVVRPLCVARGDDAPVGSVEPIREGWRHRRMINEGTSDLYILVAQDDAGPGQLVHVNERHQGHTPLGGDAGVDVEALISKNSRVILSIGGGPQVSTCVRRPLAHDSRSKLP